MEEMEDLYGADTELTGKTAFPLHGNDTQLVWHVDMVLLGTGGIILHKLSLQKRTSAVFLYWRVYGLCIESKRSSKGTLYHE